MVKFETYLQVFTQLSCCSCYFAYTINPLFVPILRAFIDVLLFEVVSPGAMSFLEIFSGKNFVF